jgi:hypothetical protein
MENSLWRHNEIYSLWHHKDEFPILDKKNFQEPPIYVESKLQKSAAKYSPGGNDILAPRA